MDSTYLTTGRAARRLGMARGTLLRAMRRGEIPPASRTPGGTFRFRVADVEAYARWLAVPAREPRTPEQPLRASCARPAGPAPAAAGRYQALVTALAQIVWTTSAAGRVVDDVPLWRAYTGQAHEAVQGHGWLDAVHPDDRARTLRVWTHAIATATLYETEHRLQRADGTYRPFLARAAPVRDEAGGVCEWVGVCTDLADRYHSEADASALVETALDGFKEVNDTFGHAAGDRLLQQVTARLVGALGAADTVARLGGDEFAVLLPGDDVTGATLTVQKLLAALEAPVVVEGQALPSQASIGLALFPEHGDDGQTLLRHADVATDAAKQAHRPYANYTPAQDPYSPSRIDLIAALRQAIALGAPRLHYQPKVAVARGAVCGAEALVRWQHPQYGLIPPDRFIPLAEQTGLIAPLTRWVLEAALTQCQRRQRHGLPVAIAVNLSMWDVHDPEFPDSIARLLRLMPGMDGVEVSQRLRADPATAARIPIIAMSAQERLHATSSLMPVNDRLPKPFELMGLYTTVARWAQPT